MPALAEILATAPRNRAPRIADLPTCPVCVDTMIAAEASVLNAGEEFVSYLWACETCGCGFVTRHMISPLAARDRANSARRKIASRPALAQFGATRL
jgi:hypothetical protein